MKNSLRKFLQFNGKNVYFTSIEGNFYVAIKPICEALKVDYSRQLRTLKSSKILGQLWSLKTIVAADGKLREMVCLPEFFIYGWLFKIQSDSKDLEEYQYKCYELLYNYFHGTITQRNKFLLDKVTIDKEMDSLDKDLMQVPEYMRLKELKSKRLYTKKALDKLDEEIVTAQTSLFNEA